MNKKRSDGSQLSVRYWMAVGFGIGFFSMALVMPQPAQAVNSLIEGLSAPCMECGNCTLEDGLLVASNAFAIGLAVVGALVLVMLVYGGFMLLISHGNQNSIEYGKRILRGTFMGLVIFLLAWTIVNTIIMGLTDSPKFNFRNWYKIRPPAQKFECAKPEDRAAPGTAGTTQANGWNFADGLRTGDQIQAVSPDLNTLINCLYTNQQVPEEIRKNLIITSISDDDIYTGTCKIESCNAVASSTNTCGKDNSPCNNDANGCVHSCGSCHYGQGTVGSSNFSHAVDFRYNVDGAALENVARNVCGAGFFKDEGDHYHISTAACAR